MTIRKRSVSTNEKTGFRGHSKRFIAIISILAASILFYGFTLPSADEDFSLTSVTIIDGETFFEVETTGYTVMDALAVADITVDDDDILSMQPQEPIKDGDTITVTRTKTLYLTTSGKTFEILTTEDTVGDALFADGFLVGKYDEVIPHVDTPVKDGMTVFVTRVYVELLEVTEEIPYAEKTVENHQKPIGHKAVIQAGKKGEVLRTFKKISKEGAGVTATLIGETVIAEAVDEIVEVGTKKTATAPNGASYIPPDGSMTLISGKTADGIPHSAMPAMKQNNSKTIISGNTAITAYGTFTFSKRIECKATAYEGSAASNGQWAGQTATGRKPVYGVVAVDPRVIPLNSKLYIESADGGVSWIYGFSVAGDTGGAIKGNRVDLCYHTLDQCYYFGRRDCIVYVLD